MSRRRLLAIFTLAFVFGLLLAAPVQAQIFIPGPPPGYGPGGRVVGYVYQKKTIISGGYGGVLVEQRVLVKQPVVVIEPQYEYDLRGIDLDVEPPEKLDPRWPNVPPREVVKRPQPQPQEKVPAKPKEEPKKPPEPPQPKEKEKLGLGEPRDEPVAEGRRLVEAGVVAFQNQEYGLAAMRFQQAAQIDPASSKALFFLGQAYFAMGKYKDAAKAVEDGMRIQPNWPIAQFQPRNDLYKGLDADWFAHKKQLETVVELHPKQAPYLFLLGHQLWFDGLREEAAVLFRRARPLVADPTLIDRFLDFAPPEPVAAN